MGNRLTRMLRDRGEDVVALVRNPEKAHNLVSLGVKVFKGDVTDKESMRKPMKGCDGVFHLAAWYKVGVRDKSPARRINVDGTRNVLELMKELVIPKGVYTSTLAVNSDTNGELKDEAYCFTGKHISVYDRTKAEAHHIADRFIDEGLPLVIVMPGLIYGPDGTSMSDKSLRLYLQRKLPVIPRGSAFCWAHVDDVAEAHILAMEKAKPGSTYIIAGPPHDLVEAFGIARDVTGIRRPMAIPSWTLSATIPLAAVVDKIAHLPEMYTPESLRVQAGVTYLGDNSKAKADLGYNPRPLDEGLRETLMYEMEKIKNGTK